MNYDSDMTCLQGKGVNEEPKDGNMVEEKEIERNKVSTSHKHLPRSHDQRLYTYPRVGTKLRVKT